MWRDEGGLSWLLPYKFEIDDRHPLFTFQVLGDEYGFFFLSIVWWIENVVWVIIQGSLAAATAVVIYHAILLPSKQQTKIKRQSIPVTNFLTGFGVILPFWLLFPSYLLQLIDVRSKVMRFVIGAIVPTLSLFRTSEAIHGFVPDYATASVLEYALYYGSPLVIKRDGTAYRKASYVLVLRKLAWFIIYLFGLGMYQSFLSLFPTYMPFGNVPTTSDQWYSLKQVFSVIQMGNNLAHAVLFQMYLTTFCEGLDFVTAALTGCESEPVMLNPVFKSATPTDFWSHRWNRLVHGVLKNGVYLPVRHFYKAPREIAVIATFLASGLFHEWLNYHVFALIDPLCNQMDYVSPACLTPTYGGSIAFMLWQAVCVALEWKIGNWRMFSYLKNVPTLQSFCVISLGLPLAHWFCDAYIRSNFFAHGQLGLPMILRIQPTKG